MEIAYILKNSWPLILVVCFLLAIFGGTVYFLFYRRSKEKIAFDIDQRSLGSLSSSSRPTKYYGIEGAPWIQENGSPSSLDSALVNGLGWGWGNWELPYRKAWFDSSYGWFFSPPYYLEGVTVNIHDGCNKAMMDTYKGCVDRSGGDTTAIEQCQLEFEKNLMSCPKMDYAAVGH